MLTCQDCERYLHAFLDHALDVKDSLDVQGHLHSCPSCLTRLEDEQTLRRFLRQHGWVPPLSQELKYRLVRQAMYASPGQSWWVRMGVIWHIRDLVVGGAASAVMLLAVGYMLNAPRGEDMTQKFVQEISTIYSTYTTQHMPLEVESPDDTVVTQWLNSRMEYPLNVPGLTDAATQLLGVRLCRLFSRKSAAVFYKRNGVDILLFAFKGEPWALAEKPAVPAKDSIHIQSVGDRPVAIWKRGGITYSMVGDLPRDELRRLAETVQYR